MNSPDAVQALAKADFSLIADQFSRAGFQTSLPAEGILQISAPLSSGSRLRLLLSVGIHGDETAPIEMLAHLLEQFSKTPHELQVDLMVVIGNIGAIAEGKRYLDADLNRLFTAERGDLRQTAEAERADVIMENTAAFFNAAGGEKWHLDLHTAIRQSHYPTFAVIPDIIASRSKQALISWLGGAGIGAVILNAKRAPTFSAYTATQFGATSCTAELGQIGLLGNNDLSQFAPTAAAIETMCRSGDILAFRKKLPHVFQVAQEIIKRSEDFHLSFDNATQNFTALEPGSVIAKDGQGSYTVGEVTEYVVFPNANVHVGQRAGLMVTKKN